MGSNEKEKIDLALVSSQGNECVINLELEPKISPNKMQTLALNGIEEVRNREEKKALLMSCYRGKCHNSDRVHKCFCIKDFRDFY